MRWRMSAQWSGRPMAESSLVEASSCLTGFADFVRSAMQEWKVPGLAVAVVQEGQVLFTEGFGLRDVARGLPVTPDTLFAIGSCTKAFTTASLALLVDAGKLDWDTPVRTYLPSFRMHDAFATERMTPRDLVTHRSGLPRHDLVWYGSSWTRRDMVDRLQYLESNKDFRTVWQYQNLMYMTAGHLVDVITGQSWEEFVQARLFQPLGMTRSNLSVTASQQDDDFARPYKEEKNEVKEIPFRNLDAVGPAGSINSSVAEMTAWLLLHLQKGRYNDVQIISAAQMAQMYVPQMVLPETGKYEELPNLGGYGLGWSIRPYRGHTLVSHGGGIDGFTAHVALLPGERIGIVVLNNAESPAPWIVTLNLCDRLLGLDQAPWHERLKQEHAEGKTAMEKARAEHAADRVTGTQPSHPLAAYSGEFAHPAYGNAAIELRDEGLRISYNSFTSTLEHYHYDVFEAASDAWDQRMKISFSSNIKGDIDSFSAPLEPAVKDIVFTRAPRQELLETAFLRQFTGIYELAGVAVTITLKGEHALLASVPGQPDYELVPYKDLEFTLKGLSGFSIAFRRDASGAVVAARITQPNGVFTATRKTNE
jgi:CubicO group peptidase (beta-lactamase class C family)